MSGVALSAGSERHHYRATDGTSAHALTDKLERDLVASRAQLVRKDAEIEVLKEHNKEITDELAWVVKDLLRLKQADVHDRCRSWLLSSQGLSTVLASRDGPENKCPAGFVGLRKDKDCSTPALTEETVNQFSDAQGGGSDLELMREVQQQRGALPDRLLTKLNDALHANRAQVHVLKARVLRLEATQDTARNGSGNQMTEPQHGQRINGAAGLGCRRKDDSAHGMHAHFERADEATDTGKAEYTSACRPERTSATGTANSSGCIEVLEIAPEATVTAGGAPPRSGSGGADQREHEREHSSLSQGAGLAQVLLRERELLRRLEVAEAARAEQDTLRRRAETAESSQQEVRRTYKKKMEELQSELLRLKGQAAQVEADAAARAADAATAEARAAAATSHSQATAAELHQLRTERADFDRRTAALLEQLDEARGELRAAEGALATAVQQHQETEAQLQEALGAAERGTSDAGSARQDAAAAAAAAAAETQRLQGLLSRREDRTRRDAADAAARVAEAAAAGAEARAEKLRGLLEEAEAAAEAVGERLQSAEAAAAELPGLRQELQGLQGREMEAVRQRDKRQSELDDARGRIRETAAALAAAEGSLGDARAAAADAERTRQAACAEAEDERAAAASATARAGVLQADVARLEVQLSASVDRAEAAAGERDALHEQVATLQAEAIQLKQDAAVAKRALAKAEHEAAGMTKRAQHAERASAAAADLSAGLQLKVEASERSAADAVAARRRAVAELREVQRAAEACAAARDTAEALVRQGRSDSDSLKSKLSKAKAAAKGAQAAVVGEGKRAAEAEARSRQLQVDVAAVTERLQEAVAALQELRDLNQAERDRHQETRRSLQAANGSLAKAAAAAAAAGRAGAGAAEREALLRDFAGQVTKLEAQSAKQQALITELQATARRTTAERDDAAAQLKERLAHAHAELAAARTTNSKLKSDFLEQTTLIGASGLVPAAAPPVPLERATLDDLTRKLKAVARHMRVAWRPPPLAATSADAFVRCLHGFLGCLETEALAQQSATLKAGAAARLPCRRKNSQGGGPVRERSRPMSATQLPLAAMLSSGPAPGEMQEDVQERFRGAALTGAGSLRSRASMPT
eukprot:jgi/Ulvmu1/3742/UM173_0015.1